MIQNITKQGEISQDKAGRLTNIAKSANELAAISADQQTPSVLIETEERDILVREYDSLTIAISSVKGGGEEWSNDPANDLSKNK